MGQEAPEVWQEPLPELKVVTAGGPPPDPAEPITSQHLGQFFDWMGPVFDYVLLDTPLIGTRLRSRRFGGAAYGDSVLLVLDVQSTRREKLFDRRCATWKASQQTCLRWS